ncbi:hypothetical protein Aduo_015597 [Ancylostoma duodenale]
MATTAWTPGHPVETAPDSLHRSDPHGLATGIALSSTSRQQPILEPTFEANARSSNSKPTDGGALYRQ